MRFCEYRPDIVVTISIENVNVASWLAAHLLGVPVAHVMYSYFLMCWRGSMFRNGANCELRCPKCRLFSTGRKLMSRYVDGVSAESRAVIDRHVEAGYFACALKRVVPGALEDLPPAIAARSAMGDRIRVGYMGRHTPVKGIETLALAAASLPADARVEFVIGGDGDFAYTAYLKERFPASTTRFLGWVTPEDFFRQVDVNVVPSLYAEPFGRVSIESQSYAIATLVARSGGLPANIIEGETGFSFDAGDHGALAQLILRMDQNRDELRRLGDAARTHAARFHLAKVAEEFELFLLETRLHAHRAQRGRPALSSNSGRSPA